MVTASPPTVMTPAVGSLDAREDAHERGLAGAVLAHDGVHLARREVEVHAAQRDDVVEARAMPRMVTKGVCRRGAGWLVHRRTDGARSLLGSGPGPPVRAAVEAAAEGAGWAR